MKLGKYIINKFHQIGQYLTLSKTEPRIKQKRDRHGNSYYQIYDTISRSYLVLASELEVRIWLENRYHCC